jgi:predicted amidohydrolase YtcJ
VKPCLFIARRVYASAMAPGRANALLVIGGRVHSVGDAAELRKAWPDVQVTDYGNATITPGLTDAHIHITEWALARQHVHLDAAESVDDCVRTVGDATHGTGWLQGRGWNPHRWGGAYPNRHQLDRVTADRPAAFQSHDMHALWVNTRALREAGIDRKTPDPAGGRIIRDDAGEPTGMLLETAAQLVVSRIPVVTHDEMHDAVINAQRELHTYGITGIHSFPGVHLPEPDPLPVLERLRSRGELKLRVLQHISADKIDHAIHLGLRSGFGGDWIRIGAVKMFLDGALGSRTAWMLEPYENSDNYGVQVLQRSDFHETVMRAANTGIATTVHAIGDAAVAMAFDVLSQAPKVASLPHRVEHVQCLPDRAIPHLGRGIICSVQPCHLMTDWPAANRHWGERSAATYAFRTILDHGAILACGSDAPVESVDPRLGFYAAVARRDTRHQPGNGWHGEQCLTSREVFAGYTTGAAAAAGQTGITGVLQPGAFADFAVWREDPLTCEPNSLLDLHLFATVINGEVVFEA